MNPHGNDPRSRAVVRPEDGALVGSLLVDTCEPPCVIACDLLGIPLALVADADAGVALLIERGLAAMDDVFEALLPAELTDDVDLRAAEAGWIWRRVVIAELGPSFAVVRLESPSPAERKVVIDVPIPADDLLHRASPRG